MIFNCASCTAVSAKRFACASDCHFKIFQSPAKKTSIRDQILAKNETEQKLTESGYRLDIFFLHSKPLVIKLDSRMLQECDNFTRSLSLFVNYGFSLPHLGIFHFFYDLPVTYWQPVTYWELTMRNEIMKYFKRSRMAWFKLRTWNGWKIPSSWYKYTLHYYKQNEQINN